MDISNTPMRRTDTVSFALKLAVDFHDALRSSRTAHDQGRICIDYRDRVLSVDNLAADTAAAFSALFQHYRGQKSYSSTGHDREQWSRFDRLARTGKAARDTSRLRLQHQSTIIASWGSECFQHYHWSKLTLPALRQLSDLAALVHEWAYAAHLLNSHMLARHKRRVVYGQNTALRIGEHAAASKIQDPLSPIERTDILAALDWARQTSRHSGSPNRTREELEQDLDSHQLHEFGLKRDCYGIIVPMKATYARDQELQDLQCSGHGDTGATAEDASESAASSRPLKRPRRVEKISPSVASYSRSNIDSPSPSRTDNAPSAPATTLAQGSYHPQSRFQSEAIASDLDIADDDAASTLGPSAVENRRHALPTGEVGVGTATQATPAAEALINLSLVPSDVDDDNHADGNVPDMRQPDTSSTVSITPQTPLSNTAHVGEINLQPTLQDAIKARYPDVISAPSMDAILSSLISDEIDPGQDKHHPIESGSIHWATIYSEPEDAIGRSSAGIEDAHIWYLGWDVFQRKASSGEKFTRPIIIKQEFQDSGMYNVPEYVDMLWQRLPENILNVQDGRNGTIVPMTVEEYCWEVSKTNLMSLTDVAPISHTVNNRPVARADEPLLTRLPRFQLLSILLDRLLSSQDTVTAASPVINNKAKATDRLGFEVLSFAGAVSRARTGFVSGHWVRCLVGYQIWALRTSSNMTPRTAEHPPTVRLVAIEKDDVLFIPAGVSVEHLVFTPQNPCLATCGVLWDQCMLPEILDGLAASLVRAGGWSDELAVLSPLREIIEELERWLAAGNLASQQLPEKGISTDDHVERICEAAAAKIRTLHKTLDVLEAK